MRDKMIRDRQKSGVSVGASVDTHAERVAASLEEALAELLEEGETVPDVRTLLRILQRRLATSVDDLVAAGDLHLEELDNDVELRQRRDQLTVRLGATVSRFRSALDGLYGPGRARQIAGLIGRTEQEPVALLAQTKRILDRFGNPEVQLDPPDFGVQVDPAAVAARFQPDYQELRDIVTELSRENRKSDDTFVAKSEAMTRYDEHFRWIAGALESLYHLAGHHVLAARVKPSTRRPGRTEEDVVTEGSDGPGEEPGSGGPESGEPPSGESPSGEPEAGS
jgi:hypothetical protein